MDVGQNLCGDVDIRVLFHCLKTRRGVCFADIERVAIEKQVDSGYFRFYKAGHVNRSLSCGGCHLILGTLPSLQNVGLK